MATKMTSVSKVSINLQKLMKESQITSVELSKCINVPTDTIKKIKSGKNNNPTIATLKPIAEYFKISVSQLIGDYSYLTNKKTILLDDCIEKIIYNIPIISWESSIKTPLLDDPLDYCLILGYNISKHSFALKIDNDNYGRHRNGEIIFVNPQIEPQNGDYLLVHKVNEPLSDIKKLIIHEDLRYLQTIIYDINRTVELSDDYRVLGVIIGYERFAR